MSNTTDFIALNTPITKRKIEHYTQFKLNVIRIDLNSSAQVSALLFDDNQQLLANHLLTIDGEDYQNWVNDAWLIEWVQEKLINEI